MTPRRRHTPPRVVRFYFSYRSPYAWLATHRLPAFLRDLPVEVEHCPVWEPEPNLRSRLAERGITGEIPPLTRERRRYIFQDVRRHAHAYGLPLVWPIDRNPRWSPPHLGLFYAREHGRAHAYHMRLFTLRFGHGADVTSPETLARVASDVGLDPVGLLEAVSDGRYDELAARSFSQATDDGVFGWPFFVFGIHKFWGNDRLPWLAATIRAEHGLASRGALNDDAVDDHEPSPASGLVAHA